MNADGTGVRRITRDSADDRRPSWHPNGDRVLFESNRSGRVLFYTVNLYNSKVKPIGGQEIEETMFGQFSPDGQKIAFAHKISEEASKLIIMNQFGVVLTELADFGFRSYYPQWSSDGSQLLFFSRHETENQDDEIYTINIDGTNKKRLTNWPKHNFCPSWSPDGSQIAYAQSMEGSRPEIYVMNADGSGAIRLTHNEDGETLPNWSPEGDKLLMTAYRKGNYELVEVLIPKL